MLKQCPHCQKPFELSDKQLAKSEKALFKLAPGKTLAMKCPLCLPAIALDKTGAATNAAKGAVVQPPPPPDLDWLQTGIYQGEEKVEDVPMALLLYPQGEAQKHVKESLEAVGYQVFLATSTEEAIEHMRFVNFAAVAFHAGMEGALETSSFHAYMRTMAMERRRYIFYILLGEHFHTLYNLEAMANSANLTVNTRDLNHLDVVLRKAIPAYEELFGALLEEMGVYGRR